VRLIEDFVDVPKHLELRKHAFLALEDCSFFFFFLKKTTKKQPQHFFWCTARLGVLSLREYDLPQSCQNN